MSKDTIGKIVVGVDGSEAAAEAVAWTVGVARQTGAEVIAVFSLEPPTYLEYAGMAAVAPIEFDPQFREEMEKAFRETWCKQLADSRVPYRAIFAQGRAAAVLAETAQAEGADLVVVGRRGRGAIAEMVMGSVSHELSHHSTTPVVLISHHQQPAKRTAAAAVGASA